MSPNLIKLKIAITGILDASITPMDYINTVSAVHDEVLATLAPLQAPAFQQGLPDRPERYRQLIVRSEEALGELLAALDLMLQFPESDKLAICQAGFDKAAEAYQKLEEIQSL